MRTMVFRSMIVSPSQALNARLIPALEATRAIAIRQTLDAYPGAIELVRTLRAHAIEVVFLSFASLDKALETIQVLDAEAKHVQVVGFHHEMDSTILRQSMRVGVREFLAEPFEQEAVRESLAHVRDLLEHRPPVYDATDQIFCFLPSKAGVGATTIAANTSVAMARLADGKVLLSDFDLNSGMLRFLFKLANENCVRDAVERFEDMDGVLWGQMVSSLENLDILHAGRVNPNYRIEPTQIRGLIGFMRRNYRALCFDLSGNLERYSIELMHEAKRVLLVVTPEIPSLHLAREKLAFLKDLDLLNRVSVVLNRTHKRTLFSAEQVQEMIGLPVLRAFPNDYQGINQATADGKLVTPTSEIGRAFSEFAAALMDQAKPEPVSKRKFLEFFNTHLGAPTRPAGIPGRD